jgi:hypothetical protein
MGNKKTAKRNGVSRHVRVTDFRRNLGLGSQTRILNQSHIAAEYKEGVAKYMKALQGT